jgi:hypothetical protein
MFTVEELRESLQS